MSSSSVKSMLAYGAPILCGLLLTGNLFFVTRFIDEFYTLRDMVWQLRQQVAVMEAKMDSKTAGGTQAGGTAGSRRQTGP